MTATEKPLLIARRLLRRDHVGGHFPIGSLADQHFAGPASAQSRLAAFTDAPSTV